MPEGRNVLSMKNHICNCDRVCARIWRAFAALLLSLALMLFVPAAFSLSEQAWADSSGSSVAAAVESASNTAASSEAAASDEEEIEDDETPMAGELEAGKPLRSLRDSIPWIVVIGVAVVIAYYAYSTLRVNRSIDSMKRRFR